jgi:hypothetical protein
MQRGKSEKRNAKTFNLDTWLESAKAMDKGAAGDAAAAVKKRKRAPTAAAAGRRAEEREPSPYDLRQFWMNVKNGQLQEVIMFCSDHPELLAYWMEREDDFYAGTPGRPPAERAGPLFTYAGMGNDTLAVGSVAVLYSFGIDVPDACMPAFLEGLFSVELQKDDVLMRCMERIKRRLEQVLKTRPALLEQVLHAAALSGNMHLFQHFNPRTSRKTIFDVTPGSSTSVLQTVMAWPDPKIRREMASDILSKSSTAYILQKCQPMTVLEQAASMPDPEMVTMLLVRLKTDGVLSSNMEAIVAATCKSLQKQASMHPDDVTPELHVAFAAVHTQLVSLLDERHLYRLRLHLNTLKENAIKCKSATDPSNGLHQQATAVLAMIPKAYAACVSSVKFSSEVNMHILAHDLHVTKAEEAVFQEKYSTHLRQIQQETEATAEIAKLRQENRLLEEAVKKQAQDMKVIQLQAATITRLRKLAHEAPASVVTTELDNAEQTLADTAEDFMQAMELRLLDLRLPLPPVALVSPPAISTMKSSASRKPVAIALKK